jgi:dissimilatory sulfite reductase related protein
MAVIEDWTPQVAEGLARELGIELTDRHWLVVDQMRRTYEQTGESPSIRPLSKLSGVPVKELYQLFPKGPAKLAAAIAGVPKPRGCI